MTATAPGTLTFRSSTPQKTPVKFAFVFPLVLCAGLVVAGAVLAKRELALTAAIAGFENDVFERVADAPLPHPGSISGTNGVIERCVETVEGLYGQLQPRQRLAAARGNCLAFAEDVTRHMPSNGFAHFLMARALFETGAFGPANAALERSYRLAAHEQWLAEARVNLAESHLDALSPQAREGHRADLALLVLSARGVRAIAYRYVSDPGFRERITTIAEALPNEEQARFVSMVRRAANQYGFAEPGR